ncbi:MAG: O-antigen ligase family protein [Deltaproteobacteria bacterium]|nr:O-antigen ligase family protein [Deltaproteobacteria bacterium]
MSTTGSSNRSASGTPSARRREHVRGRWSYSADLSIGREKTIHAFKQILGLPIPWLMVLLPVLLATSRAATEIASWGLAILTLFYIATDSFARNREFQFFRLGPDISLAACLFAGILSIVSSMAIAANSASASLDTLGLLLEGLGHLRWIPLLYLFVYAWELFPGLNRIIVALVGTVTTVAVLAWIQHFQGVDWLTGESLVRAPTGEIPYYVPRGFLGSTEALATLFACTLPFPVAAACLRREGDETDRVTWIGFGLAVVIALALVFTYRPGLWWAGGAGALALLLFPGDRRLKLLASIAVAIAAVWFLLFFAFDFGAKTPAASVWTMINVEEAKREEVHRAQMNSLVTVWETSPLLGVSGSVSDLDSLASKRTSDAARYESVNIYFLMLARSGIVGLVLYLAFVLHHLLNTLRLFHEIPESHHRHRVLAAGCFASQCAFHVAGLFWSTMTEAFSMNLFILVGSMSLYMTEHYAHGLVPDDNAL